GLCSGGTCPAGSLRQSGNVSDAANFVFNGAISPAMNGTSAAIDYNTGSSTQLADIRARSRTSSSPLGSMAGELTLGTSSASDGDFTCSPPYGPPCRWGDYAGASPDPNNAAVVWGSNQLNGPPQGTFGDDPAWLTRNFAVTVAPPVAALTAAPNPVAAGAPVTLSAAGSSDPDGTIANYAFDLNGDGTFETNNGASPTVTTTYSALGTVNPGVQVTDNDGGKATATVAVTVIGPPVIAAKVLKFTETRSRFAVGPRPTAITAKSLPRGTTFKYSLSNLATVRIKVERKTTGARVNGRCVKRTSARRHKPKCTRFVKQGTLTRNNRPAGASRLKFSGRIGSRKLKPGRYRATITAQAAGGPVSVGRSLSFTILKG
ncbi:MAG TPA: PKD domain-containing protein, partial [Solirubrobacteraceae bacterium]